ERRSRGLDERHGEFGGNDLRERRLAQSRWPREQDVVKRLAAACGGGDRHRQLILDRLLPDEILQPPRAPLAVELELVARQLLGRLDPLRRTAQLRALRNAWAISSSVVCPSAPSSSSSISLTP